MHPKSIISLLPHPPTHFSISRPHRLIPNAIIYLQSPFAITLRTLHHLNIPGRFGGCHFWRVGPDLRGFALENFSGGKSVAFVTPIDFTLGFLFYRRQISTNSSLLSPYRRYHLSVTFDIRSYCITKAFFFQIFRNVSEFACSILKTSLCTL
jgi:hypothetical protein